MPNKQEVEITLTKANAEMAEKAAALLKTTVEVIISLCLAGSTNPTISA